MSNESSYRVIENLMRGQPSPRMGLRDPIWNQTLQKWVHQGYPTDEQGRPVDPVVHFRQDWAAVGGGFDSLPLRGYRKVVEETDEWHIVRNGAGAELKYWKSRAGTPEHIRFHMTSRKVWEEEYRPYLLGFDPQRLNIEGTRRNLERRRQQGKWTLFQSLFIYENMRRSMGDLCMYESFLTDPGWIHDYCRVNTDFFIRHFRATLEQVGKPDGVRLCEDLGYKNGLICSPQSLAELVFPYYKELVDFFHSYDLPVVLHSCGGVEEALDMILEAGFDALDPLECAAGCDPIRFAESTDNRLVLSGGFDKRILESGDRTLIRRELESLLGRIRRNGIRYVFSTDHSVSTNVDYGDYQYMLEVFRDNMGY